MMEGNSPLYNPTFLVKNDVMFIKKEDLDLVKKALY